MKVFVVFAVACLAFACAEEEKKKESDIKTFKRLIPADVLRGNLFFFFL